jgi:tetraacyldisaccharide 4'-kinase
MNRLWLAPLTPLYAAGLALRNLRLANGWEPVRRLRWPVVSIGNLSTGGAGKTPLVIALAKALARRGLQVDVLSRGYGRQSQLPVRVDPDGTAEEFGDEPLLIAREAGVPVYVARQRYEAGLLAESEAPAAGEPLAEGRDKQAFENLTAKQAFEELAVLKGHDFSRADKASGMNGALAPEGRFSPILPETPSFSAPCDTRPPVHLLDDGFQHRQLHRDVDILLLNRHDLADSLLPAGNLREPLSAIHRATVLAVPEDEPEVEQYLRALILLNRNFEVPRSIDPIWRLKRKMRVPVIDGPVAAFCGIARPGQFFAGLAAAGLRLAAHTTFPDHHSYTAADLSRLLASARASGATALITTEKDRVRLGKLAGVLTDSLPLISSGLSIEIEHEDEGIAWLMERLARNS